MALQNNRKLSLVFLFLAIFSFAYSSETNITFRSISVDDGLSNNFIKSIYVDQEGYIWIGSLQGLDRLEGNEIKSFNNVIPSGYENISSFCEDDKGNLYIGTSNGVLAYNKKKEQISIAFNKDFHETVLDIEYQNKQLFIGTIQGLVVFSDISNETKRISFESKNKDAVSVNKFVPDNNNNLWIASGKGLIRLNTIDHSNTHYESHQPTPFPLSSICLLNNELYMSSTAKGLISFNISTEKFGELIDLNQDLVLALASNNKDKIYIGTDGGGLKILNIKNGEISNIRHDVNNVYSLASNAIYAVLYHDEVLWLGTYSAGLSYTMQDRFKFHVFSGGESFDSRNKHVRSFYLGNNNEMYIGTRNGFYYKRQEDNNFKLLDNTAPNLESNIILSIYPYKSKLLIGLYDGGLVLFNSQREQFEKLPLSDSIQTVYSIDRDRRGNYWISSFSGVYVLNPQLQVLKHFNSQQGALNSDLVYSLTIDSQNLVWIGTDQGISIIDASTYMNQSNDFIPFQNSFKTNYIYQDMANNIWLCTERRGLIKISSDKKSTSEYTKQNDLPDNSITGITETPSNEYWISTLKGFAHFDPGKMVFTQYNQSDGLPSLVFNPSACYLDKNGVQWWGSEKGLMYFETNELLVYKKNTSVGITGFYVNRKEVSPEDDDKILTESINTSENLVLKYKYNSIGFRFAAFNHIYPSETEYLCFLDGLGRDWQSVNKQNTIFYDNLKPGKYVFKVKTKSASEELGANLDSITFEILRPPWLKWWAFLLYGTVLFIILRQYRNFTLREIQRNKRHELDQVKIRFFMNVSHEFRTPLSLILSPLNQIKEAKELDSFQPQINNIERSTWKLFNLVNELLDFRKLDLNAYKVHAREGDVVEFTRRIVNAFEPVAKEKKLSLSFKPKEKSITTWIDTEKFEKIINNLLSNSIKFTNKGGKITVTAELAQRTDNKFDLPLFRKADSKTYFCIRIKDTGIGMSHAQQKNIFNRFYQVNSIKPGTGIGLNLVKSFVELHHGYITVSSELKKGSEFSLFFPLGNEHLKESELEYDNKRFYEYNQESILKSLQYDLDSSFESPIKENLSSLENSKTKYTILIVEDNKLLREQIRSDLEKSYKIKEARNGVEGLDSVTKFVPDLIVSDVMMPQMDGIEFCKRVKEDINTCHIPVVLLTAKNTYTSKIEGYEFGADAYITKPFNSDFLKVRISTLLKSREQLRTKYQGSQRILPAKEITTNNLDEAFLEKVTNTVLENIKNEDFSVPELREKMTMGRSNFFDKLLLLTGQNPSKFIRTIRIKYAASLFDMGNTVIKDVCYESGFNSPSYFIRSFKEFYKQTPSEYIEKLESETQDDKNN